MRLKSSDGQLQAINNRNNAILHSPKRLNTVQNSNNKIQFSATKSLSTDQYKHATTEEIRNISTSTEQLTIEEVAALNVQIVTQEVSSPVSSVSKIRSSKREIVRGYIDKPQSFKLCNFLKNPTKS